MSPSRSRVQAPAELEPEVEFRRGVSRKRQKKAISAITSPLARVRLASAFLSASCSHGGLEAQQTTNQHPFHAASVVQGPRLCAARGC